MPAEVEAAGGEYKLFAHFDVPYVKWGMKNPSHLILRVNDKVEIAIHTVVRPQPELTSASSPVSGNAVR
jgi:hypothetical protein